MGEFKHIKEMKCPECGGDMKEYAIAFRCRLKCGYEYLRFFPDDERIRDLQEQINHLNAHIEILKNRKMFKPPEKLKQVMED